MTKANTDKKPGPKKKRHFGGDIGKWLVELASRFGISGTIILVIIFVFLRWGTEDQKHEFIDRFLLLKFPNGQEVLPFYVCIVVVLLYLITLRYYVGRLKIKDEKIKDLEGNIEKLEKRLK